jgi:glycosyltransferase involved in cell wall biosynthesis
MRLASVGPFPPYRGGIAQFNSRLSATLEKECEVIRTGFSRLYPSILFPGRTQFEPGSPGLPAGSGGTDSCNPFAWARSRRASRASRLDYAVIQWWHPFFAPSIHFSLPGPSEVPRVAVCHNVLPHEAFPFGRLIARRFLGSCRLLVVHGAGDEEIASGFLPREHILRLFIPVYDQYVATAPDRGRSRRILGYSDSDRVVLFFGLIRPYKGLDDLLESVAAMGPEVRLLIVGECYGDPSGIRRRLAAADLATRSTWVDEFVPDSDVGLYFNAADVVALPYRHATQSAVAQVALAFRKPLVLTRTGGLPELVEEGVTGSLAPPGSPDGLGKAIRTALDISGRQGAADRIASFAGRFSWDEYASRLLERLR